MAKYQKYKPTDGRIQKYLTSLMLIVRFFATQFPIGSVKFDLI